MFKHRSTILCLATVLLATLLTAAARADDLRNIKRGEPVPAFRLPTIDGATVDSESMKGSVVVLLCLSAEQRRSELAAMDSEAVIHDIGSDKVKMVHVTADVIQKPYFEKFRQERGIHTPLALDADRTLYAKLGLIVFPTTVILDKEGRLSGVMSLHDSRYKHVLDAEVRHALGQLNDEQFQKKLAEEPTSDGSPKSVASAHRALARSLREKGRLDAAQDELKKAIEQDPTNREIFLDLAELNILTKDLDAADANIQKVLEAQADHRRAKQLKGIVLFYRGKYDDALVLLEQALVLNPNPEQAHYYLGLIYEQKGDQAKAIEHYREALRRLIHEPGAAPAAAPAAEPAKPAAEAPKPAAK
jgi:thioredoxin-like negative regulator of GroEL